MAFNLGSLLKLLEGVMTVKTALHGLGVLEESARATAPNDTAAETETHEGDFKVHRAMVRTMDERVAKIIKLIQKGKRSARIQLAVAKILSRKCGDKFCIPEKDHKAEIEALFKWVRSQVRYLADPRGVDVFRAPERTLFEFHAGDCFPKGTLVLCSDHVLATVESLRPGDSIWGYDKWSTVTKTWDRGTRKTWLIRLNNGATMRLTPEHKVWVKGEEGVERAAVRSLKKGMRLIQPERIPFGSGDMDPARARIEGLYLSDGWSCTHEKGGAGPIVDFCISGKDGFPKEAQKRLVKAYCDEHGLKTYWHKRYIAVRDREWAEHVHTMGAKARLKHALSLNWNEGVAMNLLEGILADAGKNTNSAGRTLTTTSRQLHLQARVLAKMAGITCGESYIIDHGGLGTHPIWRLTLRQKERIDGRAVKPLMVKEVIRDNQEVPCVDFETDDHFVWLPESDWTVSQCDDSSAAIATVMCIALETAGYETRLRVVAVKPNPPKAYSHIVAMVGLPQRAPEKWMVLDASVNYPAGWYPKDRISGHKDYVIPA